MALPKLDIPVYETTLPSGRTLSFRPFLVKEEKLLLMASQSKDDDTIVKTIMQILTNCVIDKISIPDLPVFDVEYLFLQLRARSVGEVVDVKYQCNKMTDDQKCGGMAEFKINLLEILVPKFDVTKNQIKLTETVGLTLRPPKFNLMYKMTGLKDSAIPSVIEFIIEDCIESIYDQNTVYHTKDTPKDELRQFVESLNTTQEKKIQEYFTQLPKIRHEVKFHCPKCHYEEDILIEGLNNFFV